MKSQVLRLPNKQKRIVRARKLLKQITVNKWNGTFFSDQKVFKVQGVSKLGKTSVVFIKKGAMINQEYYCSHVLLSLIPEMDNLAGNDCFYARLYKISYCKISSSILE